MMMIGMRRRRRRRRFDATASAYAVFPTVKFSHLHLMF
jgi:hypothetical protein